MLDAATSPWPEAPDGRCELPARVDVAVGIVGAGVHGAALARELTLRGLSCAAVDKGAVGGGTSQWSSQLLHGGIRYLQTGDIRQMREGLAERAAWARIAPSRCRWEAFWMPHAGILEGLAHRFGIGLYDHWGAERPGWPEALRLGSVPDEVYHRDPRSKGAPFRGAVAYADLLTHDQDLVRDLMASSEASRLDFHEIGGWEEHGGELQSVRLRDRRDGSSRTLAARRWIFALGPWMDACMKAWFGEERRRLRLSSGIHLWFDAIPGCDRPWALMRGGGRILFVIPRDGMLQVGTTERAVEEGWVPIADTEREELYQSLDRYLPAISWRSLPVRYEELGVRPLVRPPRDIKGTPSLSREAVLEQHPRFSNLRLVLGGKLTTSRALMAKLATELTGDPCPASMTTPLKLWDGQEAAPR